MEETRSVRQIIEQLCEEICDKHCKYKDTCDENCECDYIRENGRCFLDVLN